MVRRWNVRRAVFGRAWISMLVLAMGAVACGPAPSPGGEVPPGAAPPKPVAAIAKYADEMFDVEKASEPPLNQAGGIPPEDLTATPKFGGILVAGVAPRIRLDPHFDISANTGWAHRLWANGLLRWDAKTGSPQADLAESWTVASDAMSYDFKIRKGIKFHNLPPVNGREVTVQDIKWSMDRVSGLEAKPGRQGILFKRYENVKEFQVINDSTLRMVMKQPDVQILAEIMHDYTVTLPKEAAIDDSYEQAKTLIGTGPFIVDFAEPAGQYRLKRNPTYWEKDKAGRQLPYLDGITTTSATDNAARQAAFRTRQSDYVVLPYPNAKSQFGDPNVRYYSGRGMMNGAQGIFMNTTKPPFNDIRVRRAVHLALDRQEYLDTVPGFDGPDSGYVVNHLGGWTAWHWSEDKIWSLPGYAKGEAKQKEIAEAKRLLAEAGYANGIKDLQYLTESIEFEVIQKQLAAIGIGIKLTAVAPATHRYASYMKDKTMAYASMGGGHTPDYAVSVAWLCSAVQNMSLYCNPEIDRLFLEERRERDTAKRAQLLDKMQQILWDDLPMAPLARNVSVHMSYKYVRGWRNHWYDINVSNGYQAALMWLDK